MLASPPHSSVPQAIALTLLCASAVADPPPPARSASPLPACVRPAQVSESVDDEPSIKRLRAELRDKYPDKRRRTVAKLAALGSEEAKALVLGALADPSPQVADEAQLVLPEFEAIGVAKDLIGKHGLRSKDPWIRLRAAEALGRLEGPIDAWAIARALDKRDPAVLRTTLWSVERLARRGGLGGDVHKLVDRVQPLVGRRAHDGVRAAALQFFVASAPDVAVRTVDSLRNVEDRETKCSMLMAMAELTIDGNQGFIEEAAGADDPAVRLKALEILETRGSRATLGALLERLKVEPRPTVRNRVVATLRWLTGFRHGDKLDAWSRTIGDLPADWDANEVKNAWRANERSGGSLAELRRLEPKSDRVAILVDFSGSLWTQRADGTCRKDLLDPEVDALLARLNQNGTFLLVPYTGTPHPFSKKPLRASAYSIRKAQAFFGSAQMRGQGNLFDAVELALSFDEIDRVIILTDGAPTGGRRWNVDLMISLLKERIRFRPVVFDFVLLDAPSRLERRWRGLAESTGGRTVALAF